MTTTIVSALLPLLAPAPRHDDGSGAPVGPEAKQGEPLMTLPATDCEGA